MVLNRLRLGFLLGLMLMSTVLSACDQGQTSSTPTPVATSASVPTVASTKGTGAGATVASGTAAATPAAGATKPPSTGSDDKLIRFGFALATSGDYAAYGKSQRTAAELAWKEINDAGGINGAKITSIFYDTTSKPDQALQLFHRLVISDAVLSVVGPTLNNEAKSADPEAQKNGTSVLAISNTAGNIISIGDYVFRASLPDSQVIAETVKQAKAKLSVTKVAMLYASDDDSSKSAHDVYKAELQKNSINILSEETFSTADTDYKTQLTKIKGENPDAIVVLAPAKPAQAILMQARNDVHIDTKVHIIGGDEFNSSALIKAAGPAAEGLIVGGSWNIGVSNDLNTKFTNSYKTKYGQDPDQFAAVAYAGFYILADAIKRADIKDFSKLSENRTKVRDALKATKDLPTVLGNFSFAASREPSYAPVVQVVKSGKLEILK